MIDDGGELGEICLCDVPPSRPLSILLEMVIFIGVKRLVVFVLLGVDNKAASKTKRFDGKDGAFLLEFTLNIDKAGVVLEWRLGKTTVRIGELVG